MLLRELYEAPKKQAVLAFGRLNPPTIGHAKLVDAIKKQDGDHYLFLSQTQKPKTDPLDFATKLKFAKQFFPGINIGHESVRTPVQALEMLQGLGYTDIIFIAGSDRVAGFQKLFDTYNGQPDKSGNVPFKFDSINVLSAGERDPDADDVSGMSASKMRAAAAAGELETFAQGVPDAKLAKTMYDAVRKGMGVKDVEPVEEGDLVLDKGSLINYIKDMIQDYVNREEDVEKLSALLKYIAGKEIKAKGKRFVVTKEDIKQALAMIERELTKGEEKDKEKYVKGMKKNKSDFKKRYGKDAEAVMYATATKMAKK
ncbi:MAG: hypothetical protein VW551_00705 [Euryarchaeota archaeon]|jgi:hypothetical protein